MENKKNISKDYVFDYKWLDTSSFRDVRCALCNGKNKTEDVFYFKVNDKEMSVKHCVEDNLMFLSPQPAGNYAETLYNHESYFTGEDDMYGLSVSDDKSVEIAKIRIEEIKNLLKDKKIEDMSLLEIGSAYGHTLSRAKIEGFKEVCGIEFSRDAVLKSKQMGLNVVLASANESLHLLFGEKKFNVIALYSVLEHVDNPVAFLESAMSLLTKDGFLVIRVPRMSTNGPWLSLLDHYWHFTEASLRRLMERFNLKILEIFPSGTFEGKQHEGRLSSMTVVAQKIV